MATRPRLCKQGDPGAAASGHAAVQVVDRVVEVDRVVTVVRDVPVAKVPKGAAGQRHWPCSPPPWIPGGCMTGTCSPWPRPSPGLPTHLTGGPDGGANRADHLRRARPSGAARVAHDQAQPKPEVERALPGRRLWPKCSSSSHPYDNLFLATRSAHERAGMPGDCVRGMNPDWCAVCQKVNHGDIGFPGTYGYPARLRRRC